LWEWFPAAIAESGLTDCSYITAGSRSHQEICLKVFPPAWDANQSRSGRSAANIEKPLILRLLQHFYLLQSTGVVPSQGIENKQENGIIWFNNKLKQPILI